MRRCVQVCRCVCSHGVPAADVFAGRLDDRLTRLVQGPVDAVVGPGVGGLHQVLELRERWPSSVAILLHLTKSQSPVVTFPLLYTVCFVDKHMLVLKSTIFLALVERKLVKNRFGIVNNLFLRTFIRQKTKYPRTDTPQVTLVEML